MSHSSLPDSEDGERTSATGRLKSQLDAKPVPVPPKEHPRLFLRASDIPALSSKLNSPVIKPIWEKIKEQAKKIKSSEGKPAKPSPYREEMELVVGTCQAAVEANALIYLLYGDREQGRQTILSALDILKNTALDIVLPDGKWAAYPIRKNGTTVGYHEAFAIGRMMVTGAIVYDWCYDLLTADEKEAFIRELERLARVTEIGYPPTRGSSISDHAGEAFLMRDGMSAGIAIYDEKQEMYNLAAGRFFKEYVPARNFFYPGHLHHQGTTCGPFRFQWEMFATWIFDRMGCGNVFHPSQEFVPYQWIYFRRPDGQILRDGDDDSFMGLYYYPEDSVGKSEYWRFPMVFMLSANYYGNPYLQDEFMRSGNIDFSNKIFELLFRDPDLKPRPVSELPLTRYFGFPFGVMVARTGWDMGKNANTVLAEMKVGIYYFGNHQHLDAGNFQLYYKGQLALGSSGIDYGTTGSYGCEHHRNYYQRTIAHNSLLVYDPNEEFPRDRVNDGGQRWPNKARAPWNLHELLTLGYKTGEVLAHQFGPDPMIPEYSYLKGDITEAYTKKVRECRRSFVFLNLKDDLHPAALIIFDKVVSSDPKKKKFWLLHSIEEPQIDRTITTIKREEDGYRGKLVNQTLLPGDNNFSISKIGGEGKEFWVFGTNYPNEPEPKPTDPPRSREAGAWRIELYPKKPAASDLFLNVMQVMDKDISMLPVDMIESSKMVGVRIADWVVLFSKNGKCLSGHVTYNITGVGIYKHLVTDLMPGTWQVTRDGDILAPAIEVSTDGKALQFEGVAGTYTLRRI